MLDFSTYMHEVRHCSRRLLDDHLIRHSVWQATFLIVNFAFDSNCVSASLFCESNASYDDLLVAAN